MSMEIVLFILTWFFSSCRQLLLQPESQNTDAELTYHPPELRIESVSGTSRDPFTRTCSPVFIPVDKSQDPGDLMIGIYDDPEAAYPRFLGYRFKEKGFIIPSTILDSPGRYWYRTRRMGTVCNNQWSDFKWFVVDERYIGFNTISVHHYPFGKEMTKLHVRDATGRIHLVYSEFWNSKRRICYVFSVDDGNTWSSPVQLARDIANHGNQPLLCINKDSSLLHVCWLEWGSAYPPDLVYMAFAPGHPDRPIVAPVIVNSPETKPYNMGSMSLDSEGAVHTVWHGGILYSDFRIYYRQCSLTKDHRTLWSDIVCLTGEFYKGAQPVIEIAPDDSIYVSWEGSFYRYSIDRGLSWIPPLSAPATRVFEELCEEDIRPRRVAVISSGTAQDYTVNFVCEGEERRSGDGCGGPSEGPVQIRSIWLKRLCSEFGFEPAECVYRVPGARNSLEELRSNPGLTQFIRDPNVAMDTQQNLYITWHTYKTISPYEEEERDCTAYMAKVLPDNQIEGIRIIEGLQTTGSFGVTPGRSLRLDADGIERFDILWTEAENYDWRQEMRGNLAEAAVRVYPLVHGLFFQHIAWNELPTDTSRPAHSRPVISWVAALHTLNDGCFTRFTGIDRWGQTFTPEQTVIAAVRPDMEPFQIPGLIHLKILNRELQGLLQKNQPTPPPSVPEFKKIIAEELRSNR